MERLPILTFEHICIDRSAYEAFVDGEAIHVPRVDFEILQALAMRPKLVISHRDLASLAWCSQRAVTEHVRRIRSQLPEGTIATIRGVGYRWDAKPVGGTPTF